MQPNTSAAVCNTATTPTFQTSEDPQIKLKLRLAQEALNDHARFLLYVCGDFNMLALHYHSKLFGLDEA